MVYLIVILGILSMTSPVQAQSFFTGPERFDAYYDMVCGSVSAASDTAEVHVARRNFQSFLKNPEQHFESQMASSPTSNLQGSAAYDLYVLCQSVLSLKTQLHQNPCQDAKGFVIDPTPALNFCGGQKTPF